MWDMMRACHCVRDSCSTRAMRMRRSCGAVKVCEDVQARHDRSSWRLPYLRKLHTNHGRFIAPTAPGSKFVQ